MKRNSKNAVYFLVLIVFLFCINRLSLFTNNTRSTAYGIPIESIFNYLIFVLLGLVLSVERLKSENSGTIIRKIDVFKFSFIILPLGIVLITKCLWYSGSFMLPYFMTNFTETFYMVISCILGFTIPISLYDKK